MDTRPRRDLLAVLLVVPLLLLPTSAAADPGEEVVIGSGVTFEPCEDTLGQVVGHPDRGCIYLGSLPDLSGPFSPLGPLVLEGTRRFWDRVNQDGGIGGEFDVNVTTHVVDTQYDVVGAASGVEALSDEVVAIASLFDPRLVSATASQLAGLDLVASELGWSSSEDFVKVDQGAILQAGRSYCLGAMTGIDYASAADSSAGSIGIVGFPASDLADGLSGARIAAAANDLDIAGDIVVLPFAGEGLRAAEELVLAGAPQIVYISVTPQVLLEFLVAAQSIGYTPTVVVPFVAFSGSFLLIPGIEPLFANVIVTNQLGEWDTDTAGHAALRAAFSDLQPIEILVAGDIYAAAWASQYVLLEALQRAYVDGDLTKESVYQRANHIRRVDSEGMYGEYGTVPAPQVVADKQSVIQVIDAGAPTGLRTVQSMSAGPTASSFKYKEPCS